MKAFILIVAAVISFSLQSATQDGEIDQIRIWYKEIEGKLKDCKLVETWGEYFEGTTPEIKGWFDPVAGQFIKIEAYLGSDHHEETVSYYLHNGTVFFTFSKGYGVGEYYTAEEMGMGEDEYYESGMEAKTYDAWEDRLYFNDGKCIRALNKSKVFKADEEQSFKGVDNKDAEMNPDAYTIAVEHADMYLEYLKNKMAE